jgi:hypothetical protein
VRAKFTERAKQDGVSIGQIVRPVIYGYGDQKLNHRRNF